MKEIIKKYPNARSISRPLPVLANVRLGLNVSSCDNTPLAIIYSPEKATRKRLVQQLAPMAWGKNHIGQVQYCVATTAEELKPLGLKSPKPGILVVQPGAYGDKGLLISAVDLAAETTRVAEAVDFALLVTEFQQKTMQVHVPQGRRLGVDWKTAIPVTDPGRQGGRRSRN